MKDVGCICRKVRKFLSRSLKVTANDAISHMIFYSSSIVTMSLSFPDLFEDYNFFMKIMRSRDRGHSLYNVHAITRHVLFTKFETRSFTSSKHNM